MWGVLKSSRISFAMINVKTGEFKLDDCKLVIYPELTFAQFQAGDIPILGSSSPTKMGYASCWFNGTMDGMKAKFTIQFRFEQVQRLIFGLADTKGFPSEELKWRMNGWLLEAIGHPPPYEYDWGLIGSAGIDSHTGEPSIAVMFKSSILDLGFKDVESFYEFHRAQPSP
jgi:hypothetical protein